MASSTKKCDYDETSSFFVAFGSFGFFLTSSFPPLKHHQPCVAKCFAASTQHWCLWKNETLNANGMIFEHHFEQSSKWTNLVSQLLNSRSVKKKVLRLWTKYLLSFARIISTVGSYQVGFIPSTIFEDYL